VHDDVRRAEQRFKGRAIRRRAQFEERAALAERHVRDHARFVPACSNSGIAKPAVAIEAAAKSVTA
jgi:hypothetical protein